MGDTYISLVHSGSSESSESGESGESSESSESNESGESGESGESSESRLSHACSTHANSQLCASASYGHVCKSTNRGLVV
jgi:hypothetical protein